MPLMGIAEYSRHRGCNQRAVYYAIERGRIKRRADGLIESEQADLDWQKNTMHSNARYGPKPPRDVEPDDEAVPAAIANAANTRIRAGARAHIAHAAKHKAAEAVQNIEADDRAGQALNFSKARAARELYDARIKKLDYEERLGSLVSRKSVEVAAFNKFRVLRDACFNIPNRLAAQVAAEQDETVVFALMENEVRSIFEDFSEGRIN